MLVGFFLLGSLWFWILLAVACFAITASVEWERPGLATWTLLGFFAALGFFGDFNILHALSEHPTHAVAAVFSYLAAGTVWAVIKWWFFVRSKRESYEDGKREWLSSQWHDSVSSRNRYVVPESGPVTVPEELKKAFASHAQTNLIPSLKRHKSLIMSWLMYWPWSMIWTMVNDPVRRAAKAIFLRIRGVLVRIRNRAFGDISADFPTDFKLGE